MAMKLPFLPSVQKNENRLCPLPTEEVLEDIIIVSSSVCKISYMALECIAAEVVTCRLTSHTSVITRGWKSENCFVLSLQIGDLQVAHGCKIFPGEVMYFD